MSGRIFKTEKEEVNIFMFLSIVIPTKNRQLTAIFAIRSALAIPNIDIEVIVHDCSDVDSLRHDIEINFKSDVRVKYFFIDSKPSMAENWNMAFAKATGEYVCGIGDDDAVLKEIYTIAKWAKANNVAAVAHTSPVYYQWPGFSAQIYNGTIAVERSFSGEIVVVNTLAERIQDYCTLRNPNGYLDLPELYHCLIRNDILKKIYVDTGKFVDATSVDIYSVIVIGKYISSYAIIDYPFTFRGASKGSNSDRFKTGQFANHFKEYKNLSLPDILPSCAGFYTTAAESVIIACKNTGQEQLLEFIDLPELYANIAIEIPEVYDLCVEKAAKYAGGNGGFERFLSSYAKKNDVSKKRTKRGRVTTFLQTKLPFVSRIFRKIVPHKHILKASQASTISEAIEWFYAYTQKQLGAFEVTQRIV
ncbi:MAG: glycosyltransferase [Chitinophagaceae bacterium]|nr:glycosyltransferase [Chitinophagaceae bacterium]